MQTISYLLNVVSECFLEVQYKDEKDASVCKIIQFIIKKFIIKTMTLFYIQNNSRWKTTISGQRKK